MRRVLNFPFLLVLVVFVFAFRLQPSQKLIDRAETVSHGAFDALLKNYVTASGVVNYVGFKENAEFKAYLKTLSNAQPINTNWSREEKLAFWINAYNAFTIELITRNLPLKSIRDIEDPWKLEFITIAEKKYSLNTIEHEILRKMNEPRIHFAIVCASYSCPKLLNAAYSADQLEEQLLTQTKLFLSDTKRNKIQPDKAELSEIFNWFKVDFTVNGSVVDFINRYSDVKVKASAELNYLPYDWSLNNK